jgi:DNA polymerase-3 subunit beta
MELQRLLQDPEAEARVSFGGSLFRVTTPDYAFSSKLVDGKFPDYTKVLPKPAGKSLTAARSELKDALSRASILSNEKFRGVRLVIEQGGVQILASNQEQEEAEESVAVDYSGDRVEIGFNVSYLIDVLSVLGGESVRVQFSDGSSSVLMEDPAVDGALYVVMPMRL